MAKKNKKKSNKQTSKRKRKYKRKTYPKELEAAWFVTYRFISNVDYVVRYINKEGKKCYCTVNPNSVLAAYLSHMRLFKPSMISKSLLEKHFDRSTILFYKSNSNTQYFTGYGQYDSIAQKLPFSDDLDVKTKKFVDPEYYILLIGIDIDCHGGEKHVFEVEALIKQYLPNTYWEYSTGGKGRHGYIKLLYRKASYDSLTRVCKFLKKLFDRLRELKDLHGFEAKLDEPAGLPYKMEFVGDNPYHEAWTTLYDPPKKKDEEPTFLGPYINRDSRIWYDYAEHLKKNKKQEVHDKPVSKPIEFLENLSPEEIKSSYSTFLSDNDISFSPPTKNNKYFEITYRRAFKLPLFDAAPNKGGDILPQMDCIREFHNTPYYKSSDLKVAYRAIVKDIEQIKNGSMKPRLCEDCITPPSPPSFTDPYSADSLSQVDDIEASEIFVPMKEGYEGLNVSSTPSRCSVVSESLNCEVLSSDVDPAYDEFPNSEDIKEKEKRRSNNCAYTNTLIIDEKSTLGKSEPKEVPIIKAKKVDWKEFLTPTNEFDIEQFWKEYSETKTVKSNSTYDNRISNIKEMSDTMKKTGKFISAFLWKDGPDINEYQAEEEYVKLGLNTNADPSSPQRQRRMKGMISKLSPDYDETKAGFKLNWQDERQRIIDTIKDELPKKLEYKQGQRTKSYSIDDIGFVYYIIEQMDKAEQHITLGNSLSYKQADEFFLREFGKKCGRNKFSTIKTLLKKDLIEKSGNYMTGLRGNCYELKK